MSVLSGVAGCLCSNAIIPGHMLIAAFVLLKDPHVSASTVYDTTLQIVFYSVWI